MDLLAAMRAYVRVIERGSMSSAARDLNIGQPAISDRIGRLEQHLGVQLLLRSTRSITCTDEGTIFYRHSKRVLEIADEACAAVAPDDQIVRGTVRLAAPQCLGEIVLPPILLRIRTQYPDLRIELLLNDRVVDPTTEGVDISLRLGPPGEGNFILQRLGEMPRVLVASPAYLATQAAISTPDDLVKYPFIHVMGLFADRHLALLDRLNTTTYAAIAPRVITSHWRPMYEMLLAGAGIGVVQQPACAAALADGRLIQVLADYSVPRFLLHALIPRVRPIPPRTRATLAMLKEHLPKELRSADLK